MAKVQGYLKQVESKQLEPSLLDPRWNIHENKGLSAAIGTAVPDESIPKAINMASKGDIARRQQAYDIQKASYELEDYGGKQQAEMTGLSIQGARAGASASANAAKTTASILKYMSDRYQVIQDIKDDTDVLGAVNRLRHETETYLHDPEKGVFTNRKLGNAMGVYNEGTQHISKLAANEMAGFRTDRQRNKFLSATTAYVEAKGIELSKHQAKELEQYNKTSYENTINNSIASMSTDYSKEGETAFLYTVNTAVDIRYPNIDSQSREIIMQDIVSKMRTAQVLKLVETDPIKAKEWFEAAKPEMLGADIMAIEPKVNEKAQKATVFALADTFFKERGLEGGKTAFIEEIDRQVKDKEITPQDREEMLSYGSALFDRKEKAQNAEYKKNNKSLNDLYYRYLKGEPVNMKAAVESMYGQGLITSEDAVGWRNILDAKEVSMLNRAIAQRTYQDKIFEAELRHIKKNFSPARAEVLILTKTRGITEEENAKNYMRYSEQVDTGELTHDKIKALVEMGEITSYQGANLSWQIKQNETMTEDEKNYTRYAKSVARDTLDIKFFDEKQKMPVPSFMLVAAEVYINERAGGVRSKVEAQKLAQSAVKHVLNTTSVEKKVAEQPRFKKIEKIIERNLGEDYSSIPSEYGGKLGNMTSEDILKEKDSMLFIVKQGNLWYVTSDVPANGKVKSGRSLEERQRAAFTNVYNNNADMRKFYSIFHSEKDARDAINAEYGSGKLIGVIENTGLEAMGIYIQKEKPTLDSLW